MNHKLVFLLGFLGAAFASCSKGDSVSPGQSALPPLEIPAEGVLAASNKLDLVVISIDTLRADRLPFYGAAHATGGSVEQKWSLSWMAQQGTLFEQVWAPAGMTLPSFGTLWTGLSPFEHGAQSNYQQVLAPTFSMELANQGWSNHAVVSNRILHKRSGVQRGFATYAVRAKEQEPDGPALLLANTAADIQAGKHTLIWAHYMAPHQPYEPNPVHLGKFSTPGELAASKQNLEAIHAGSLLADAATLDHLRGLYDEEILTANDYVVTFLSGLEAQYQAAGRGALLDNAVVVVLSDHGEELANHESYFMHAKSLYAGATHVPLVVLGGQWSTGKRIPRGLALAEVLPMVLHGQQPQSQVYFSAWRDFYFAARDDRWTLIHNPSNNPYGPKEPPQGVTFLYPQVALFDRLADPLEQHDVAAANPDVTRRLLDELHAWYFQLNQTVGDVELSAEQRAMLEESGYAGGGDGQVNLDLPWRGEQWNP
jgi:arylsulfatase A-like enzyme